ncbi:MAG: T9SS C-terminal target domain-containing protein [Flavobacteriia bacterium]|nr:T9SS C-terminal target domain-containing protein [Flavobacteriia bacterium]
MKKIITSFLFIIVMLSSFAQAPSEKCATMSNFNKRVLNDPLVQDRMNQMEAATQHWIANHPNALKKKGNAKSLASVYIPVVVHVLWNDPIENISSAQIQSQIDILNEDFRLLNADSLDPSHPFWAYTVDSEIEFCLASYDPNGNPTNGIVRTFTNVTAFDGTTHDEKYTASGGSDNWDPTEYLNIWVCNLDASNGTLGYATFPSDLATTPNEDGVVIRYEAFGNIGTAGTGGFSANDLGRTATHEVGHWLNLRHIWGDAQCGDDFVNDTEIAEGENYGCPSFPHRPNNLCGSGPDGEMYMNYMDYVDDYCMNMFTFDQADRMWAALSLERSGLLTSMGCADPSSVNEANLQLGFEVYPNPSSGEVTIGCKKNVDINVTVYDVFGSNVKTYEGVNQFPFTINVNDLSNGIYFFKISSFGKFITKKVTVTK